MQSATIIDFDAYLEEHLRFRLEQKKETPHCDDLGVAIQTLIQEMRKLPNLKQTG